MNVDGEPLGKNEETLADEFIKLGENIRDIVKAAWESDEGSRFRQDIKNGLEELGESLDKLSKELNESQTAQHIREEMEEIAKRVQTGEVESTIKSGILSTLKSLNLEIEKLVNRWEKDIDNNPSHDESVSSHNL
jgi:hypothetical protein